MRGRARRLIVLALDRGGVGGGREKERDSKRERERVRKRKREREYKRAREVAREKEDVYLCVLCVCV